MDFLSALLIYLIIGIVYVTLTDVPRDLQSEIAKFKQVETEQDLRVALALLTVVVIVLWPFFLGCDAYDWLKYVVKSIIWRIRGDE